MNDDFNAFEGLVEDCCAVVADGVKVCDPRITAEGNQLCEDLAEFILEWESDQRAVVLALSALLAVALKDLIDPLPAEPVN